VVFFDPWLFSSKENLFEQFFHELTVALGDDGAAMRAYGQAFLDVVKSGLVDYFVTQDKYKGLGNVLVSIAQSLGKLDQGHFSDVYSNMEDLVTAKHAIESQLEDIDYKLIVVVDNIDRLDPKLTTLLFQFLGAIVKLPNILYILLFDRNVVTHALQDRLKLSYIESVVFLEKIVHLQLDLPDIALSDLIKERLGSKREFPSAHLEEKRREKVERGRSRLALDLAYFLETPRTVHATAHAYQSDRVFTNRRAVLPGAPICNAALRTKMHDKYLLLLQNDDGTISTFLKMLEFWIGDLRKLFPYHPPQLEQNEGVSSGIVANTSSGEEKKDQEIVGDANFSYSEQDVRNENLSDDLQEFINNHGYDDQWITTKAEGECQQVLQLFAVILRQAGIIFDDAAAHSLGEHLGHIFNLNDYTGIALDIPSLPDSWVGAGGLQLWFCLLAACRERKLRNAIIATGSPVQDYVLGPRLNIGDSDAQAEPDEASWRLGPRLLSAGVPSQDEVNSPVWPLGPHLFSGGSASQDDDDE
jgi:hypothetical protein